MNKAYLFVFLIFNLLTHFSFIFPKPLGSLKSSQITAITNAPVKPKTITNSCISIYDSLKLNNFGLSREAYNYAIKGLDFLRSNGKLNNDQIISIVDFSLPSNKKRLFIVDLKNYKILFNTYVAHGRNSGKDFANEFSNESESYKSSLGFYITEDTYIGNHGYSLRLQGEEKGINDNANNRAIVMHSAWYVNENIVKSQGYIGRSQGCPALPEDVCKPIIEKIKNGSCLFLYSPDKYYMSHSQILQKVQAA